MKYERILDNWTQYQDLSQQRVKISNESMKAITEKISLSLKAIASLNDLINYASELDLSNVDIDMKIRLKVLVESAKGIVPLEKLLLEAEEEELQRIENISPQVKKENIIWH